MKNIHVLPTDKPSRLHTTKSKKLILYDDFNHKRINGQYLYITSNEEIKEGDWYYLPRTNSVHKCIEDPTDLNLERRLGVAKIILTTGQDLINDGVQAIDDEFLEWFVKNPTCEWIRVEEELVYKSTTYDQPDKFVGTNYKIILEETPEEANIELSKAVQQLSYDGLSIKEINAFKNGVEWQVQRSYNEEDMIEFNEWSETSKESADFWRKNRRTPTMDDSYNLYMREKRVEIFKIWKEQHKKK